MIILGVLGVPPFKETPICCMFFNIFQGDDTEWFSENRWLVGSFKYFWNFHPYLEKWSNLTHIFKGVETTNQMTICERSFWRWVKDRPRPRCFLEKLYPCLTECSFQSFSWKHKEYTAPTVHLCMDVTANTCPRNHIWSLYWMLFSTKVYIHISNHIHIYIYTNSVFLFCYDRYVLCQDIFIFTNTYIYIYMFIYLHHMRLVWLAAHLVPLFFFSTSKLQGSLLSALGDEWQRVLLHLTHMRAQAVLPNRCFRHLVNFVALIRSLI